MVPQLKPTIKNQILIRKNHSSSTSRKRMPLTTKNKPHTINRNSLLREMPRRLIRKTFEQPKLITNIPNLYIPSMIDHQHYSQGRRALIALIETLSSSIFVLFVLKHL